MVIFYQFFISKDDNDQFFNGLPFVFLHINVYEIQIDFMLQKTYFKTKDYCKVKFSLQPESAEVVEILGLNSDWNHSIIMSKKKDGTFSADVNLPKDSKHEFKYLVDNALWINDPEADSEVPNVFGGSNSVVAL